MAAPTTSGLYDYSPTVAKIITRSLRQCGVIAEDETPTSSQAATALDAMNAMVKAWQASGIHVWTEDECLLFLQPNQTQYQLGAGTPDRACLFRDYFQTTLAITASGAGTITVASTSAPVIGAASLAIGDSIGIQLDAGTNYWTTVSNLVGSVVTLGSGGIPTTATSGALVFAFAAPIPRPLRVPNGRRFVYASRQQTPLIVLARFDYDWLPNTLAPTTTGVITQYFYDPHVGDGVYASPMGFMSLWPTPGDNSSGMRFVAQRPLQHFASLANIADFPAEWTATLTWNLALELCPEYDVPAERVEVIAKQAGKYFGMASQWDREPEAVQFGVAVEPAYRTG